MIEAMPGLRSKISDKQRDSANSASLKQFPGGVLVIAGANSAAELKSQPVRYIFEDEVDEYPDDVDGQGPADELAEKRADTFERNKKIYRTSTTTIKGRSKIWRHYEKSDKRQYHVPCPHCQQRRCCAGRRCAGRRASSGRWCAPTTARSSRCPPAPKARRRATPARSPTSGTSARTAARASTSTRRPGCSSAACGSPRRRG
jgi:hypothetical protein